MVKSRYLLLVMIILITVPGLTAAQEDEVRVLYVTQNTAVEEALVTFTELYSEEHGVLVELETVTPDELNDLSLVRDYDIVIGPDRLGDMLLEEAFTNFYCVEPEDCGPCLSDDPPDWCQFAGGDFSEYLIPQFNTAALCLPDQCPQCTRSGELRPPWCDVARSGTVIDLVQIDIARILGGRIFIYGIPVWWGTDVIFANENWFEDAGIDIPQNLEQVAEFIQIYGEHVAYDSHLSSELGEFDFDDGSVPLSEEMGVEDMTTEIGLVIAHTSTLGRSGLVSGGVVIDGFSPIALEDYVPALDVVASYMINPENFAALDFAYALYDEEAQFLLYNQAGVLPANGEALAELEGDQSFASMMVEHVAQTQFGTDETDIEPRYQ